MVEFDGHGGIEVTNAEGFKLGTIGGCWSGCAEGWCAEVFIPRRLAKGNLKEIAHLFVRPVGEGGPGQRFACEPTFRRVAGWDGGWIMRQTGGLDI